MAELDDGRDFAATSRPIPAHVQLLAVAWLRWRMFANGFRRPGTSNSQVIGLLLTILLRVIVWPVMALWMIGPAIACGSLAWAAVANHHPGRLISLLAGVFALWQFLSINGLSIAASISNFDPSSLVRFPLPFGRYLLLRILLGLLTASTVAGCLALFATAVGVGIADHDLAIPALVVLAVYAAMNILFARMIAAWLERLLAGRRVREIFGGLMALFLIGIQLLNFRRLSAHAHGATANWALNFWHGATPFLRWLPPTFAGNAILFAGRPIAELGQFVALLAWTTFFLGIFAIRLHKQFLGEYLSEGSARQAPSASGSSRKRPELSEAAMSPARPKAFRSFLSPTIAACLRKEWVYLRGNGTQLIGMVTPLIFVVILSKGLLANHPSFLLPGALGYVLFALLAGLYNIFGADGAGVQLYLLAPVRLRDVVVAKNIASLTLIGVQTVLAWLVVLLIAKAPVPFSTQVSAGLWVVFVIGANLTVGTIRSIQAPRKFVPGQVRQMRTPTNRTSSLLVVALLFGSILLQIPVTLLCRHTGHPWLAALIFAPLAAAAVIAYGFLLRHADQVIYSHRDLFAEELCRT